MWILRGQCHQTPTIYWLWASNAISTLQASAGEKKSKYIVTWRMWGWFQKIKLLNAVVMVRVPVAGSSFMIIWKRTRQMTGFRLTWRNKNTEFWQTSSQKGKSILWEWVCFVSVESILKQQIIIWLLDISLEPECVTTLTRSGHLYFFLSKRTSWRRVIIIWTVPDHT